MAAEQAGQAAMLDPGSTGGAVGNDGALANNLTDPCWLLHRAARLLHDEQRPMRSALAPLARAVAEALSAYRHYAQGCGEPPGEQVELAAVQLRLHAGDLARTARHDHDQDHDQAGAGEAEGRASRRQAVGAIPLLPAWRGNGVGGEVEGAHRPGAWTSLAAGPPQPPPRRRDRPPCPP